MIQLDCQCQIKDLTFTPSVFRNPTLDTTQKTPIPCDSGPCGLWIPIFGGQAWDEKFFVQVMKC